MWGAGRNIVVVKGYVLPHLSGQDLQRCSTQVLLAAACQGCTCRPIPLQLLLRLGSSMPPQRPALSPTPTSARLDRLPLRHMHGLPDNPTLNFQGLCTAHCQAITLPLSHLYASLPPPTKPFTTTCNYGRIARRTSRGTPRTIWVTSYCAAPASSKYRTPLAPTSTHMVYHPRYASYP